ncbi:unnamed protein product [Calicophoron daubneyi]|uniref:Uncharacterized protein n=1 Tax=Calicophoron daubneyi TaxID=300641 RepID=A0AAV2SZS7_CALDB
MYWYRTSGRHVFASLITIFREYSDDFDGSSDMEQESAKHHALKLDTHDYAEKLSNNHRTSAEIPLSPAEAERGVTDSEQANSDKSDHKGM